MARKPKATAKAVHPKASVSAGAGASIETPVKRPPWRPSSYKPEYCDLVIEYGRAGKSKTWIAATIGVLVETLNNWAKDFPDFFVALSLAKQLEQLWWENASQDGSGLAIIGQSIWSRSMAARFPKDWRESSDVNHGVQDSLSDLMLQLDGKTPRIPGDGK